MTVKNGGSTYSARGASRREVSALKTAGRCAVARDGVAAFSSIEKLKSRSMKLMAMGRSKKKRKSLRRPSEDVLARPQQPQQQQQRVVHFCIPERPGASDEEHSLEFTRSNPFRRSSKFRQPLRRVSRAKGSPPPVHFARIRPIPEDPSQGKLEQPNFDQTSDGESEREEEEEDEAVEEELPPILLQSLLLSNIPEVGASDGESSDEETYTILPAVTVASSSTSERCSEGKEEEEEERHAPADPPPPERRANVTHTNTLIRRRSSYRASVRRSSRRLSSCAVRRESLAARRRSSVGRRSSAGRRRSSIVVPGTVRRKSTAVPGYVVRRRSVVARSPYASSSPQQRIKRRKRRQRRRRPRKIVVIGEMCSGKSSLISAYCRDKFSEVYVPTILTSCMTDADVLGEKVELVVVEVAGRIDYARLRRCAYQRMDLVILCYSADSPASLAAIKNHWLPELLKVAPRVPYILVGTKKDIRDEHVCEVELSRQSRLNLAKNSSTDGCSSQQVDTREKFITTSQGLEAAEAMGAKDFIECSAMYREGTRDVFETAAKIALRRSPRRKKKHSQRQDSCTIL